MVLMFGLFATDQFKVPVTSSHPGRDVHSVTWEWHVRISLIVDIKPSDFNSKQAFVIEPIWNKRKKDIAWFYILDNKWYYNLYY